MPPPHHEEGRPLARKPGMGWFAGNTGEMLCMVLKTTRKVTISHSKHKCVKRCVRTFEYVRIQWFAVSLHLRFKPFNAYTSPQNLFSMQWDVIKISHSSGALQRLHTQVDTLATGNNTVIFRAIWPMGESLCKWSVKTKLSLCLSKHNAMETYGGVEV
jgi:hypothetical protein